MATPHKVLEYFRLYLDAYPIETLKQSLRQAGFNEDDIAAGAAIVRAEKGKPRRAAPDPALESQAARGGPGAASDMGEQADFVIRAGAFWIDWSVFVGFLCLVGVSLEAMDVPEPGPVAAGLAAGAAYFCLMTWKFGGPVGKLLAGIKVVDDDGEPLSLEKSALRALLYYVSQLPFGLGFLMAFFRRDGKSLHDYLAGTKVVVGSNSTGTRRSIFFVLGFAGIILPGAVVFLLDASLAALTPTLDSWGPLQWAYRSTRGAASKSAREKDAEEKSRADFAALSAAMDRHATLLESSLRAGQMPPPESAAWSEIRAAGGESLRTLVVFNRDGSVRWCDDPAQIGKSARYYAFFDRQLDALAVERVIASGQPYKLKVAPRGGILIDPLLPKGGASPVAYVYFDWR